MNMAIDYFVIGIVSRFILFPIIAAMAWFFMKKFNESKAEIQGGNPYFQGNAWFFIALSLVTLLLAIYELLDLEGLVNFNVNQGGGFPGVEYSVEKAQATLYFMANLGGSAIYVALTIVALVVFLVQIKPLEKILQKKAIVSNIIIFAIILLFLVYIPFITFTIIHFIIELIAMLALVLAFLMNFILTAILIKNSTGIVRKRAIYNITGFFLILLGLIWGMRVGWTRAISRLIGIDGVGLSEDVVVGNLVILFASYLYYRAFTLE